MAEVSEVHVRVNGWCDACGGIGRSAIEHQDHESWGSWHTTALILDLRESATIMEPDAAAEYRELADHIERVLRGAGAVTTPWTAQQWILRPPKHVSWTPEELTQIGRAVQAFQAGLPGIYREVSIEGVPILPPEVQS